MTSSIKEAAKAALTAIRSGESFDHLESVIAPALEAALAAGDGEIQIRTNSAVNTALKWLPIDENTPRGRLLWLINRPDGVAHKSIYRPGDRYTHYQHMPVFDPEEPY